MLNFDVPFGNDFQLGVSAPNSGLYRNNSGVNYPYNIGDMISVTGSSAGNDYYYFYYNIEVEAKCFDVSAIFDSLNTKKLTKITDVLGREVNEKRNIPLFYIYNDGTVKKKIIIE